MTQKPESLSSLPLINVLSPLHKHKHNPLFTPHTPHFTPLSPAPISRTPHPAPPPPPLPHPPSLNPPIPPSSYPSVPSSPLPCLPPSAIYTHAQAVSSDLPLASPPPITCHPPHCAPLECHTPHVTPRRLITISKPQSQTPFLLVLTSENHTPQPLRHA